MRAALYMGALTASRCNPAIRDFYQRLFAAGKPKKVALTACMRNLTDDRHRLAEITLGVARRMGQRHEHLLSSPPVLPDVVLDYGVLTVEPVLVPQPLEDSLGRVALLPGNSAIAFQDRVNHAGEWLKLGSPWRTLPPVAWRYRVGQHLAHGVPVQAEHPGGFPNTHALHHAGPPHLNVHLHWIHPSHPPKADKQPYRRWRAVQFSNAAMSTIEPPMWSTLPPPFTGDGDGVVCER